jgi:hypothetical protein
MSRLRSGGPTRNGPGRVPMRLGSPSGFNHRRLHSACSDRPPAEYEAIHHRNQQLGTTGAET